MRQTKVPVVKRLVMGSGNTTLKVGGGNLPCVLMYAGVNH